MYQNLKTEMSKKDISNRAIATVLNVHENTVGYKINGDGSFTIEEAFTVKEIFFPSLDLSYLFKRSESA
jgi:plasmid maintenance system antidote protein VapI